MTTPLRRVTLFKVPKEEDQNAILEKYKTIKSQATKDGAPYILSLNAGKVMEDFRNKGFNLCAITVFATVEDMQYYDTECETHKELKALAVGMVEDIMTVYMESVTPDGLKV